MPGRVGRHGADGFHPRACAGEQPVELVLALKDGDNAAWAHKYTSSARVTAYNKGEPLSADSPLSEVALANVGREAHAYLYHIGEHHHGPAPRPGTPPPPQPCFPCGVAWRSANPRAEAGGNAVAVL